MTAFLELMSREVRQYLVYVGISVAVVGLAGASLLSGKLSFSRFLGATNPLAAAVFLVLLGAVLLSVLLSHDWFVIYGKGSLAALPRLFGLAGLFGLEAILVDLKVVLPADLNVPFPESVMVYPVMGFGAEILLHVLPLALILIAVTAFSRNGDLDRVIGVSIFAVALLEPILQVIAGFSKPYPTWVYVWMGLHVFLVNLAQLIIFRRYDFVAMYSFRLAYYAIWHLAWGFVRLGVLF